MRGHQRLRAFLKAYRNGASVEVAANVADMDQREAELHEEQEKLGNYADIKVRIELRGSNQAEADDQLKAGIEVILRLTDEKKGIQDDIKAKFAELKSAGFDKKMIQNMIKLMEMDPDKRAEFDENWVLYREALGID